MYLLTQFHFSQKDLAKATSLLQEVNVMNLSLDHMKEGLKTFSKYLPIDLVSNLIKTGQSEALGGSKREITILFVDIKAFTPLAEELPASQIFDYLFQYFTEMGRVIEEEQGVIDKYLGDGFMAFFGAPESLLEHPNHACRAALKMKKALQKLQLQWVQQGKKPLDHRIGINTGTVLVGNFGSLARMEYTAIGDVVNTASRLEELNKSYGTEVILGETTARRVEEEFLVRPLDWTTVKGKKQPLPIYELICSKQEASSRLREAVTAYREGLELYHKADYPAALEKFVAAEALFERVDSPTRLFIAKCRSHLVI
jgi:adenylate cyclase